MASIQTVDCIGDCPAQITVPLPKTPEAPLPALPVAEPAPVLVKVVNQPQPSADCGESHIGIFVGGMASVLAAAFVFIVLWAAFKAVLRE